MFFLETLPLGRRFSLAAAAVAARAHLFAKNNATVVASVDGNLANVVAATVLIGFFDYLTYCFL